MHDFLKNAVNAFIDESPSLLEYEVYEPAMSHRIAFHLERLLEGTGFSVLNVDCEYNKHIKGGKTIDLNQIPKDALETCNCWNCKNILEKGIPPEKAFRPDIILHRRGVDDLNVLVIEIKKNTTCPFDLEKLRALTLNNGEYKYELGVFVNFSKEQPQFVWFRNGLIVNL